MYNHNKAQQSKNRVHISWDILYDNNGSGNDLLPNSTKRWPLPDVDIIKVQRLSTKGIFPIDISATNHQN